MNGSLSVQGQGNGFESPRHFKKPKITLGPFLLKSGSFLRWFFPLAQHRYKIMLVAFLTYLLVSIVFF